jgi:hypothetical protein
MNCRPSDAPPSHPPAVLVCAFACPATGVDDMSPYEIEVMLHYYSLTSDYPDIVDNPPVWRPTIEAFIEQGMLRERANDPRDCCYFITDRGRAYVEHLCEVQLPICKWVQP